MIIEAYIEHDELGRVTALFDVFAMRSHDITAIFLEASIPRDKLRRLDLLETLRAWAIEDFIERRSSVSLWAGGLSK